MTPEEMRNKRIIEAAKVMADRELTQIVNDLETQSRTRFASVYDMPSEMLADMLISMFIAFTNRDPEVHMTMMAEGIVC